MKKTLPQTTVTSSKKSAKAIVQKMLEDKKAVAAYLQGKLSLEELNAKGIRFA